MLSCEAGMIWHHLAGSLAGWLAGWQLSLSACNLLRCASKEPLQPSKRQSTCSRASREQCYRRLLCVHMQATS